MKKSKNSRQKGNGNTSKYKSVAIELLKTPLKEVVIGLQPSDVPDPDESYQPVISRHSARVTALQLLYDIEITGRTFLEVWNGTVLTGDPNQIEFSKRLVQQTHEHEEMLDEEISKWVEHWTVDRLALTDKLILRMALCELFILEETPPKVVINEAIEIAKEFSTSQSGRFINGILDAAANARIPNLSDQ
ncbi:MAG: transcription antitermination factor NusB [bacterium]|nr:transcription antitermination factor NusB [bacterium]